MSLADSVPLKVIDNLLSYDDSLYYYKIDKVLIPLTIHENYYKNLIVKVFNLTESKKIIGKIEWNNIENI